MEDVAAVDGHVVDAGLEKQDVITAADVLDGSDVAEVLEDARDGAQYRRGRLFSVIRLEGNGELKTTSSARVEAMVSWSLASTACRNSCTRHLLSEAGTGAAHDRVATGERYTTL